MQPAPQKISRWIFFAFFFVSGFCSLVYQVIWTRLAFASFGIITPVLSVVISVFMLGLSVGSWRGRAFGGFARCKKPSSRRRYFMERRNLSLAWALTRFRTHFPWENTFC